MTGLCECVRLAEQILFFNTFYLLLLFDTLSVCIRESMS